MSLSQGPGTIGPGVSGYGPGNVGGLGSVGGFIGNIRISSIASTTAVIDVYGRTRDRTGAHQFTMVHTPATDRTATNQDVRVVAGSLEAIIAVMRTSGVKRGQCYVAIHEADEDGRLLKRLARGYCYSDGGDVSLGQDTESGPGGGEGAILSIDLGNPAAGADYTDQTVPTNAVWRVIGFAGTLVADATAADRRLRLDKTDGTTSVGIVGIADYAITASQTRILRGMIGSPFFQDGGIGSESVIPIMLDGVAFLPEAFVVDFNTEGLVAGDNWGDGQLLVEEWLVL